MFSWFSYLRGRIQSRSPRRRVIGPWEMCRRGGSLENKVFGKTMRAGNAFITFPRFELLNVPSFQQKNSRCCIAPGYQRQESWCCWTRNYQGKNHVSKTNFEFCSETVILAGLVRYQEPRNSENSSSDHFFDSVVNSYFKNLTEIHVI